MPNLFKIIFLEINFGTLFALYLENNFRMKPIILHKLNAIKATALATGMEGRVTISFDGVTIKEFDAAIDEITEIYHEKNIFAITPKLECYVLLN